MLQGPQTQNSDFVRCSKGKAAIFLNVVGKVHRLAERQDTGGGGGVPLKSLPCDFTLWVSQPSHQQLQFLWTLKHAVLETLFLSREKKRKKM